MPLLSNDRTRQWFIEAVDKARTKDNFQLWAYVIMPPEHVSILLHGTHDPPNNAGPE